VNDGMINYFMATYREMEWNCCITGWRYSSCC